MKAIIISFIFLFNCATGSITTGQDIDLADETYVDDIPFNTEMLANQALSNGVAYLEKEAYVDDIPFDTKKIYYDSMTDQITAEYQNEDYIDDIPTEIRNLHYNIQPCHLNYTSRIDHISVIKMITPAEIQHTNLTAEKNHGFINLNGTEVILYEAETDEHEINIILQYSVDAL